MARLSADADRVRIATMWERELELAGRRGWMQGVAGVDEAGRGPLAGPVVAAAVILPLRAYLPRLNDSKALSPTARESLAAQIRQVAEAWAIGEASVAEIDQLNILRASHLAMRRALSALPVPALAALIDGLPVPGLGWPHLAVVRGDSLGPSISAASILAKQHRDQLMVELDCAYPGYGLARHKGYPTPEHIETLGRLGPCPVHRRSFHWQHSTLF